MVHGNMRTAQKKGIGDKSIYIILPINETGIKPGDNVIYEVLDVGKVLLTRTKKESLKEESGVISYIDNILHHFGMNKHYEIRKRSDVK